MFKTLEMLKAILAGKLAVVEVDNRNFACSHN